MIPPGIGPTPDQILDALDPEQRQVAKSVSGAVCVLAGAGTGKTRAITHRIAYGVLTGVMAPQQTLAVTFTARAAGEMRGRLRALGVPGVQARTFHAAALRQLQYFWPRAFGSRVPRLIESKLPLVGEAVQSCRLRADRTELRDITAEIEWAKATQVAPDDYAAAVAASGRRPPRDAAEIARVYAAYDKLKSGRGEMDFEDVLLLTIGLLDDRIEVREAVQAQYRHFTVDEYQDVNPLQQRLLDVWAERALSLCVVGDASQTIYSFTGASPSFLLGFRGRHRGAETVELVRDYRSTPQVVELANRLMDRATGAAARHRLRLVSQRPDGPRPVLTEYPDEPAEADGTARRVRALVDAGVSPASIAVLFRTNAQSEAYEQALADHAVPYLLRGAERFFDRPEIRQAGVLLRGAARSAGGDAGSLPGEVAAVLAAAGWSPEPPAGSGHARDRWESLRALVRLAGELAAARPSATLADFVDELAERAAAQHAPTVEGVTLASLHAAKGLEWDAVFLVGLTEGMMPIGYADTPDKIEEERRLLYVGITRAREHLTLSWALSRTPGGRGGRRPSRFLDDLGAAAPSAAAPERPRLTSSATGRPAGGIVRRPRSGPARCRVCGRGLGDASERKLGRCLDCPSDVDEALLDRLRDWRRERAAEQSQPPFCVFTDATLTAIAEARPVTLRGLSAISGVSDAKLRRYGGDVVALCAGREPGEGPAVGPLTDDGGLEGDPADGGFPGEGAADDGFPDARAPGVWFPGDGGRAGGLRRGGLRGSLTGSHPDGDGPGDEFADDGAGLYDA